MRAALLALLPAVWAVRPRDGSFDHARLHQRHEKNIAREPFVHHIEELNFEHLESRTGNDEMIRLYTNPKHTMEELYVNNKLSSNNSPTGPISMEDLIAEPPSMEDLYAKQPQSMEDSYIKPEKQMARVYLNALRRAAEKSRSAELMAAAYLNKRDPVPLDMESVYVQHKDPIQEMFDASAANLMAMHKRQLNWGGLMPNMPAPAPIPFWTYRATTTTSSSVKAASASAPAVLPSAKTSSSLVVKSSSASSSVVPSVASSAKPSLPASSSVVLPSSAALSVKPSASSLAAASSSIKSSTSSSSSTKTSSSSSSTSSKASTAKISIPTPGTAALHGHSTLNSDLRVVPNQYWGWYANNPLPTLPDSMANQIGPNANLITQYPLYTNGTGAFTLTPDMIANLAPVKYQPGLSRDGGKGGTLNGVKMFIFADTGISSPATSTTLGSFEGFVSNSVAVDVGMNGANGQALSIQDGISQWSNDAGTMRGFLPMTTGEQAYNSKNAGNGQRYAIWPESSIIPLTNTTAALYAPIIYTNVNYTTGSASFPYVGVTLSTISVPTIGGPVANRVAPLMWGANDVEWGCVGGLRSWGPSGVGGTDGSVYIFGAKTGGLLLAKVAATDIANINAYQYYAGNGTFTSTIQTTSSSNYVMTGAFSTLDVFYSPKHKTFILVYQTYYADNDFYWRYLNADHAIIPQWQGGSDPDYVANIWKYPWSQDFLLYTTPAPTDGSYTYGGGAFPGYYDAQDITNGGSRMLLTWTQPTGENPGSVDTGYFHMSAEIDWN